MWGEPLSGIVNPFTCYICDAITLNGNETTLNILSDTDASEIVSVNFWLPWTARYQWEIDHVPREIFKTFRNLKAFVLPGQIQSIDSDDFADATHLERLELSNSIKLIPETAFIHLPELRRLDLSWNRIAQIDANAFSGLKHLKRLHLDRNCLTFVDETTFRGVDALTNLTISHNKIERIADDAFDFPNLIEIDLSNNKLRTLSNTTFGRCIKLQKVDLKSNDLRSIGETLYQLRDLHYINLDNNHIEDVRIESFARQQHLDYLSLQQNGHQWTFDTHSESDVDANQSIQIAHKSSIRELRLAGNGLKSPHILRYLRRIGITELEKLDVDGNAFDRIDLSEIEHFPRLRQINLGQNRWSCEWLNDTIQQFESTNVGINLYSSHFPMTTNETHINYIQCF